MLAAPARARCRSPLRCGPSRIVVQSLGHGSQAVGGAAGSGDDLVFRLQGVVVNIVNDGGQVVAGRSGDNDLLGAGFDMSHGLFLGGVETGALEHDVNTQLAPGALFGILDGVDGDLFAVNDDGILGRFDGVLVLADDAAVALLGGVILEQVRQHGGAGQVVDRDDFVALGTEHLTESKTADPSETINCNFHCHCETLLKNIACAVSVPTGILPVFFLFCNLFCLKIRPFFVFGKSGQKSACFVHFS